MRKTVAILGIPIDDLDTRQALERLEEFIRSGRFHQVATANTDFLIKAHSDPELRAVLRRADLVVPDGMPVVLASRWLKSGLRERVTGADIVPKLAALSAQKGYRIFMLGAKPEVARAAKERLEKSYPGLQIVGCVSPPVGDIVTMDNDALLEAISEARPDILLVAFGNPKQEKWIHMHRHRLEVPVCIGVGGTFDFIAGTLTRAPGWMQRSGTEWLFRLIQEPRRLWRRYFKDLVYFSRFIAHQLWVMRQAESETGPRIAEIRVGDATVVSVIGPLSRARLSEFQLVADRALNNSSHLILDLYGATHVDSAILGTFLNLPKRAAAVGRDVRLVGMSERVRRVFRSADAEGLFHCYGCVADALRGDASTRVEAEVTVIGGRGDQALITLRGWADAESAQAVQSKLTDLSPLVRCITVDLREVEYVECGMLSVLAKFADNRRRAGHEVLFRTSAAVAQTIEREQLGQLFRLVETEAPLIAANAAG